MEVSFEETTSRKISGHLYLLFLEAQGRDFMAKRRDERRVDRSRRKTASRPGDRD